MKKDLRKRLEEAATISAIKDTSKGRGREDYFISAMADHENGFREGFIEGAEFGYKEAIAQAKEWLEKKAHFANAQYCNCEESEDDYYSGKVYGLEEALADFEADMNKLWEGEK